MNRRVRVTLFAALASCSALACGGTANSDLFDPVGAGGSSSGSGGASTAGAGGGGGVGGDIAAGIGGGAGTGGMPGDGAVPRDAASPFDAVSSDARDAAASDAGEGAEAGASAGQVACGIKSCNVGGGAYCCVAISGGQTTMATCNAGSSGAACAFPSTSVRCQGPDNCQHGEVCCATYQLVIGIPVFSELRCDTASNCTGTTHGVICSTSGSDPCPQGGSCQQAATLPQGYNLCQ